MTTHTHPPFHHLKWGIFYILVAWLFFTLMATISREISPHVNVSVVLFFQNFISLLMMIPWIFLHGIKSLKTQRFGLIFLRSIGGLLAFAFLFLAVQKTSLVDAVLLNNAAPLLIPFVVLVWLKIPINHKLWPGIIAGFIGIILILKPGKEILNPGALYALAAAICLSIVMIAVRLLSYTEKTHAVLLYYFAIASLCTLPIAAYFWKWPTAHEWAGLVSIGVLSGVGQWTFIRAFHHAKPSHLGPFCYMAVVYSGLIEWILWGQVPDLLAWIGISMVCAGGIWSIRFSQPPPPPK